MSALQTRFTRILHVVFRPGDSLPVSSGIVFTLFAQFFIHLFNQHNLPTSICAGQTPSRCGSVRHCCS